MILLTINVLNHSAEQNLQDKLSYSELLAITENNVFAVLRILETVDVKVTFFIGTSIVSDLMPLAIKMVDNGHEVALYNEETDLDSLEKIKKNIENAIEKPIKGFRQKDQIFPNKSLKELNFNYVSNIDNADILFPFKRLQRSTEITEEDGLSLVPESISPYAQIPYNDFVFQVTPHIYYQNMVFETLKTEDFVLIYLDSRQFTEREKNPFKIPFYRKYNSGKKMEDKLESFLNWLTEHELATSRIKDYIF